MKTIRRNWLKKQVELGKVEARCELRLTDDYRFDNATDFGKTEWLPAYLPSPTFEKVTLDNGNQIDVCTDPDLRKGQISLHGHYFDGNGGYAAQNDNGIITLKVHGNLYYSLRVRQ